MPPIMHEGQALQAFIDHQRKSKKQIAEDLGMSRTNLYQLFGTRMLAPETKKRFEEYFNQEIFTKEAVDQLGKNRFEEAARLINGHVNTESGQPDLINALQAQVRSLENHCSFLQKTYEEKINLLESKVEANSKITHRYLKIMIAQIKAASLMSLQRVAGNDKKKLVEERRTLDRLVGEFLENDS